MKKHVHNLLLMAAILLSMVTQAQVTHTTFRTGVNLTRWITLSSNATTVTFNNNDNGYSNVMNIGFPFRFGGTWYSQFSVNTNAVLRLGSRTVSAFNYVRPFCADSADDNLPKIVPYGRNLNLFPSSGQYVKYEVTGTAPHRVFVVEFRQTNEWYGGGVAVFQTQLYEDSNKVLLLYGTNSGAMQPCQIGIASSLSDIITINPSNHTASSGATTTTVATWPGNGRYYEFLPDSSAASAVGDTSVYWTSVVISRPAGYVVDGYGNVTISTPEGLAWLISTVNGLNGQPASTFAGKIITLTSDIDISAYKWTAIGSSPTCPFRGTFEGNQHTISGIYVNETTEYQGLFGYASRETLKNIGLVNGYVKGNYHVGGLVGCTDSCSIFNCYSNLEIVGNYQVGGIAGEFNSSTMKNSYVLGSVTGSGFVGGLAGATYRRINFGNCYIDASVNGASAIYTGMAIGFYIDAYSDLSGNTRLEAIADHIYYLSHTTCNRLIGDGYGRVYNSSSFSLGVDSAWMLHDGVSTNGVATTDLLTALNAWVIDQSDTNYCSWRRDTNDGHITFGNKYGLYCQKPASLVGTCNDTCITLSWTEMGTANQWQIEYGESGFVQGSGTRVNVTSNPYTITGLMRGNEYDVYVRSVCSSDNKSPRSERVSVVLPDVAYWTSYVTSRPTGYVVDNSGNVSISSAEGLAWLISTVNGLNGQAANNFANKRIELTSDIDISGRKWTAIGTQSHAFSGIFDGKYHSIIGVYVNERAHYQGLFGFANHATIRNVGVTEGYVKGIDNVGAIAGRVDYSIITNCHSNLTVVGTRNFVGGLIGYLEVSTMSNSYSRGKVMGAQNGGLVGYMYRGSLCNTYTTAMVSGEHRAGKAIGFNRWGTFNHFYYLNNDSVYHPVTGDVWDNITAADTSSFAGSDTTWTLSSSVTTNNVTTTNLLVALNSWVDSLSDSSYRQWQSDAGNINGGYPILSPRGNTYTVTVNSSNTAFGAVSGGGTYCWSSRATWDNLYLMCWKGVGMR